MKTATVAAAGLVMLLGCASGAPYQRASLTDPDEVGYMDRQLSPTSYRVGYFADCKTSRETALNYAILRAAEIGVQRGFRYFAITDRQEFTSRTEQGVKAFAAGGFVVARPIIATCPSWVLTVGYFNDGAGPGGEPLQADLVAAKLSRRYHLGRN